MTIDKKNSLLLLGLLLFAACNETPVQQEDNGAVPVTVEQVSEEKVTDVIHASGMLSSKEQLKLSFKTGGIIDRILVDEGRQVSTGQLLAELDLAEVSAHLQQAEIAHDKAIRDLDRIQGLYNDNAATLEQLQNAQSQYEVTRANLQIAQFNFDHSAIHAPSSGKIVKRLVGENELIGAGMPVFIFSAGLDNWVVRTGLSDKDIVNVSLGDKATITLDAYPGKEFSAEVREIAEAIDPQSATYEVELWISDAEPNFKTGFSVDADIFATTGQQYKLIPMDALIDLHGMEGFVFVPENGTSKKTHVKLVRVEGDYALVHPSDFPAEEVITQGADYVDDGKAIQISN